MPSILIQVLAGLAIASLSHAYPSEDVTLVKSFNKRAPSPDNTCGDLGAGNGNGYTCDPNAPFGGGCCSASGYCGSGAAYCGAGCQSGFGTCSGSDSVPTDPDLCGPNNGNNACLGSNCCSAAGYCGNTTDYCGTGCQAGFGDCTAGTETGGDGTCGPQFGNKQCPSGQCCSASGYCGTTSDYCQDPSCAVGFGKCDSDLTPAGPSTLNDPRPLVGPVSYDNDIFDCVQNNVVALTYDDGPYLYTTELLDILKSYGFKATFFITGNNLAKGAIDTTPLYSNIIKRMIAEGHQVASHTWSHYSLTDSSSDLRKQQMVKNERAIANIIGKYPTYMRPPYSQCSAASGCEADMKALGYHRIYFDLDTQDYLNPLPSQIQESKDIVRDLLAAPASDYLSIQHDLVQQSVSNLTGYYFDLIRAKGWKGVTAGTCLEDPEANWYRTPGTGATPPTTAKPSAVVPTTTTSTSSQSSTSITVPSSSPTCTVQAGKFCGTIPPFGDKQGCQTSSASCYQQSSNCLAQAGRQNKSACDRYKKQCEKLTQYCSNCGFVCSSTAFSSGSTGAGKKRGRGGINERLR